MLLLYLIYIFCMQQFEIHLVNLGDALEAIVTSQKRQLQMGVKVSPELIQLVRRFHHRWNKLKHVITERRAAIDNAMVKYNPETMGYASKSCASGSVGNSFEPLTIEWTWGDPLAMKGV